MLALTPLKAKGLIIHDFGIVGISKSSRPRVFLFFHTRSKIWSLKQSQSFLQENSTSTKERLINSKSRPPAETSTISTALNYSKAYFPQAPRTFALATEWDCCLSGPRSSNNQPTVNTVPPDLFAFPTYLTVAFRALCFI